MGCRTFPAVIWLRFQSRLTEGLRPRTTDIAATGNPQSNGGGPSPAVAGPRNGTPADLEPPMVRFRERRQGCC